MRYASATLCALLLLNGTVVDDVNAGTLKLIGETAHVREAASFRVEVVHQASLAIIYDHHGGLRQRLLTGEGRLTGLDGEWPRSALFDKYVWDDSNKALYLKAYGGPVMRLDLQRRAFVTVEGTTPISRTVTYVSRWKGVVIGGKNELLFARPGELRKLRERGPAIGDVVRADDLPRFRALLIENLAKELFIRSADGVVHAIGRYSGAHDTTQRVAELRGSPGVQVSGAREAVHIEMARSAGVWRPLQMQWVELDSSSHALFNGYVPALDALVINKPSWRWLDWLRDRSGYYSLGRGGLYPIGSYAQRRERSPYITTLPTKGLSFLQWQRDEKSNREVFRFTRERTLVPEQRLGELGRFYRLREVVSTGQIIATGSKGVWHWAGTHDPSKLSDMEDPRASALPLTREVIIQGREGAIIIDQRGRPHPLPPPWPRGGAVLQAAPNRIFVIGNQITEWTLPPRYDAGVARL